MFQVNSHAFSLFHMVNKQFIHSSAVSDRYQVSTDTQISIVRVWKSWIGASLILRHYIFWLLFVCSTWQTALWVPEYIFCFFSACFDVPLPTRSSFIMNFTYSESFFSAVMKIIKMGLVEKCVFLHYRQLGLRLFQENWTGVIWEMFRERCFLIGSKGLLYTVSPADEPRFLTPLKQTQMVNHRPVFELPTITKAWRDPDHPDVCINHLWLYVWVCECTPEICKRDTG